MQHDPIKDILIDAESRLEPFVDFYSGRPQRCIADLIVDIKAVRLLPELNPSARSNGDIDLSTAIQHEMDEVEEVRDALNERLTNLGVERDNENLKINTVHAVLSYYQANEATLSEGQKTMWRSNFERADALAREERFEMYRQMAEKMGIEPMLNPGGSE